MMSRERMWQSVAAGHNVSTEVLHRAEHAEFSCRIVRVSMTAPSHVAAAELRLGSIGPYLCAKLKR